MAAMVAVASYAGDNQRMVVVATGTNFYVSTDIREFEKIAKLSSEIGATHIDCAQVEPSMWQWNLDRFDPYPCWSMQRGSLFKFIVPEQVKEYIPEEYANRNLEMLKKRGAVMKKYGLKGYFNTMDPAYLPEKAYRDHPDWRGPRCDQARRARHEYYAPCIDNKEVRQMFVDAFAKLCKTVPIEYVNILCNDSGAGLCWYQHLYPGANGPASCKSITMEDRVLDFLSMWQEGGAKAGVDVAVNLGHTNDVDNVIPRLKKGQSLNNKTSDGSEGYLPIGSGGWSGWYNEKMAPVNEMSDMVGIVKQLQAVQANPKANVRITFLGTHQTDFFRLLKMYFNTPVGEGSVARYKALNAVAATFVGEQNSEKLVHIWENINEIETLVAPYNTGGTLYELGTQHQRWLTRPLVAFPEELKGDDLHYWRDFLFQAQTEKEAMDMLDLQAHRWLDGYGGFFILNHTTQSMLKLAGEAIKISSGLESLAKDKESEIYLKGLTLKLKLFCCIAKNAINVVEFQWIMDESPKTCSAEDKTHKINWQGDVELVRVNQIVRDEIDNCHEIISLLDQGEAAGIPLLVQVNDKKFEQVLFLGPDIQDQLRHKITIMEDHRRDFLRIWRSKNL